MEDGLLIEQVSLFPQLYVKTDPRYKNIRAKENAWKTIEAILEETPEACEHRWKILRNKYTTLKRERPPSGSGASEITWPYFEMMGFLDPYLLTRKSFSNIKRKPEAQDWDSMSTILDEDPLQEKENSPEAGPSTSSASTIPPKRKKMSNFIPRKTIPVKKPTTDLLADKMTGCFESFQKVLETNTSTQVEDDEHFVKSLTRDMKIFSHKEIILIKNDIYSVLKTHLASVQTDSYLVRYLFCDIRRN